MINFFRKTRKQLANENKFKKYFKYAFGEIVLVVLGILIALQINNWNERRKKEVQFKSAIEFIYNDIEVESQWLENLMQTSYRQVDLIDMLMENPNSISNNKLPYIIFYVDNGAKLSNLANSQSVTLSSNLDFDPENLEQIKVTRQIASYIENRVWAVSSKENLISPLLYDAGIPIPEIIFGLTEFNNFESVDTTFFKPEEVDGIRVLLKTEKFNTALRTIKADRLMLAHLDMRNSIDDAKSVQKIIKDYYPEIRLLYSDVGIIGTAINGYDNVGTYSTPLTLTDPENSIWETDLYLKDGTVKFRTRDSWNENWGGIAFPKGKAIYFWENIPVTAGNYHIILNLNNKTYEFIKLAD